jgi:hypothetical protein
LVGKVVKLAKPFVVMASDDEDAAQTTSAISDTPRKRARVEQTSARGVGDDECDGSWNIVGIVRKKLYFKTRPQPIVKKG